MVDVAQGKPCERCVLCLTPDIDDLDCMLILYLGDPVAAAAEVDGLKQALKKAEAEATEKKTDAEKAAAELEKAKHAAEQHEA